MDIVLKTSLDEIEGRLAEILAVLQDIRTQGNVYQRCVCGRELNFAGYCAVHGKQ